MTPDHTVEVTEVQPPIAGEPIDPHAEPLDSYPSSVPATDEVPTPAPSRPTDVRKEGRGRWWAPRTLTSRLVIGVVALVGLLVVATSTATYAALHAFLISRLDQQLEETANPDSLAHLLNTRGTIRGLQGPQTVYVIYLSTTGDVEPGQPSAPGLAQLNTDASRRTSLAAGTDGPISLTSLDGVRLRAVAVANKLTLNTASVSEPVTVVVGLSTGEVQRTLHRLFLIELAIGGGAVLVAFVATSYGVRLSLRPLRRVTRTAQEVTAELSPEGAGLDRRVPVTDTDTEVGQVAASVNTLLGAVESQFAARVQSEDRMRQFLADASHELRTPLTSIRGYAELSRMRRTNGSLESDTAEDAESPDADTLNRIESEGTRMSRLVEDLLLLARSDQGASPHREPVPLGELIADAVHGIRAAYPERRIDVVVPTQVVVEGDRDQLMRVLRNLITNAAVHTPAPGPIRVSAYALDGGAVLEVADSGPGLPPEEAAHVFERFWRADKARTRARGGTGLGLAIVSSIVQAHGGTVTFDSSVETGSTVMVRLPVSTPDS